MAADNLLIGAHTSIAGGLHNALLQGANIGATTIQIFTSNQKQWQGKTLHDEAIALWKETVASTEIKQITSHSSYLINLGSNKPDLLQKSRSAFAQEIHRCLALDLAFLNFHPGAATGDSEENCLERIIASILEFEPLLADRSLRLLLETTAGQGTSIGHRFEQLETILKATSHKVPIGVCIDTCHIFAAGYDIRTKQAWETTLKAFDETIGLNHLYALHLNDSLKPFAERKDRHASLGKGAIGLECFHVAMTHPKLQKLPKYLETPFGATMWKEELSLLRKLAKQPYSAAHGKD